MRELDEAFNPDIIWQNKSIQILTNQILKYFQKPCSGWHAMIEHIMLYTSDSRVRATVPFGKKFPRKMVEVV
jgi:hypothetical protein